ncbi:hypothetical protein PUN28_005122 [Cardiocondyla obscurior]|uniref:Uncharacterized protein n=1 Tax=Cardiocondyla obscurior TaxID=286306 RepID=A0AAW2GFX9_9HYME
MYTHIELYRVDDRAKWCKPPGTKKLRSQSLLSHFEIYIQKISKIIPRDQYNYIARQRESICLCQPISFQICNSRRLLDGEICGKSFDVETRWESLPYYYHPRLACRKVPTATGHGGSRYGLSYGPVLWGARVPRGSHRLWI